MREIDPNSFCMRRNNLSASVASPIKVIKEKINNTEDLILENCLKKVGLVWVTLTNLVV